MDEPVSDVTYMNLGDSVQIEYPQEEQREEQRRPQEEQREEQRRHERENQIGR